MELNINPQKLSHAYVVEGERDVLTPLICDFCEHTLGLKTKGNPDFFYQEFETLGIEDARSIRRHASLKPLEGKSTSFVGRKIFVISFSFITREAQNALLKLLEEPTPHTHFFLITARARTLLPTVQSRVLIVRPNASRDTSSVVEAFLKASIGERMNLLMPIIEEKNKNKALSFVVELEEALSLRVRQNEGRGFAPFLDEILTYKKYLHGNAPSLKMILEHIAYTLPTDGGRAQ